MFIYILDSIDGAVRIGFDDHVFHSLTRGHLPNDFLLSGCVLLRDTSANQQMDRSCSLLYDGIIQKVTIRQFFMKPDGLVRCADEAKYGTGIEAGMSLEVALQLLCRVIIRLRQH